MPSEAKIQAIIKDQRPEIQRAFLASIQEILSEVQFKQLVAAIADGRIEDAVRLMNITPEAFEAVEDAIQNAYRAGGRAVAQSLPAIPDPSGVGRAVIRFSGRLPRAERIARRISSELIVDIIGDQRTLIRGHIADGIRQGVNPTTSARRLVGAISRATGRREGGIIGLTTQQSGFVDTARAQLQSGDPAQLRAYLTRQRRDRRFDGRVRAAIESGKPVRGSEEMVGRYSDRLLVTRAETIARTEALQSVRAGRFEGFLQVVDSGAVPETAVTRTWRDTGDGRERDTHAAMDGQVVIGMTSPFMSPSGARLMFPGDTSLGASGAEVIQCRCHDEIFIDFAHESFQRAA